MNLALSLLLTPVWVLAAFWWWGLLRNPRRRVWREDRRALRAWQQTRKALR
jgi:hypothetical protein